MNILVPITYKDVFGKETPENYFDFIAEYPKNQLMARMSFLAGQAKVYLDAVIADNKISTHLKFLEIFELPDHLVDNISVCLDNFKGAYHLIYSRDTILYGMEEILQSDLPGGENNEVVDRQFKFSVFCFLMCINDVHFTSGELENDFTLEEFNASLLPVNNVSEYNAMSCCIKGVRLFQYLLKDPNYKVIFREYIQAEYHCTVEHYIGFFLRWGLGGTNIIIKEDRIAHEIFKKLSAPTSFRTEIRRLSSIRVSPVYQVSHHNFVVLDPSFLLGKIYYQFIYEFWFSCVKAKGISPKIYFKKIGEFFQEYTAALLKRLFAFTKHPVPLCLSELDYKTGKGNIEFTDFYARENRKLVFCEIKLGNLNDNERYSGDMEGLYAKGEKHFFDSLRQLEDSIKSLDVLKAQFDPKLESDKKLTVYPVCVLNDKIYDFKLMKITFGKKWEEKRKLFPHLNVKPLVVFQIEELETIVYRLDLNNKNKMIWKVLDAYSRMKIKNRAFGAARLDDLLLDYPKDIKDELQGYMDLYKNIGLALMSAMFKVAFGMY
jgi:hypothetical protein